MEIVLMCDPNIDRDLVRCVVVKEKECLDLSIGDSDRNTFTEAQFLKLLFDFRIMGKAKDVMKLHSVLPTRFWLYLQVRLVGEGIQGFSYHICRSATRYDDRSIRIQCWV
jgi:hypothetical protein